MSRRKYRLYKRAKQSGKQDDMDTFRQYRKGSAKEVKRAKLRYVNERVLGGMENGNTKPFYGYIKSLRMDNTGLPALKLAGSLVTSAIDKATVLLEEFGSIFTQEDVTHIPWLGPAKHTIGELTAEVAGVRKLLMKLKPHKASGPDQIPTVVLKELASELAPVLAARFNQSLSSGVIPGDWSWALITPVFKKGNYRPVSLTSVVCKVLEHIVCAHILRHLERHHLLTNLQHGFRKGHSCESQLLITLDDLFHNFDQKKQTDVGVLDFSRAFDTVPHERLLGKLAHHGVQGTMNTWIRAFLTGRSMRVIVDGERSGPTEVLSGVPQGTVLGPLLFLIYINDMPRNISEGTHIPLFADDCLVYRPIHDAGDQAVLQHDLDRLHRWAVRWGMTFNPSKCYIMHIARSQRMEKHYQMCGTMLGTVHQAKYLGVTISDDLQWRHHVSALAKKGNTTLHMISRNLRYCPQNTRSLAYSTLVRPKLEYCASVWDPHQQRDIDALERINRRAARVTYNKLWRERDVSVSALLADLKWEPLSERR